MNAIRSVAPLLMEALRQTIGTVVTLQETRDGPMSALVPSRFLTASQMVHILFNGSGLDKATEILQTRLSNLASIL